MASQPPSAPTKRTFQPPELPDPPQPTQYLYRKIDITTFSAPDWYDDSSTTIKDALMTILLYTCGKPCALSRGVMVPPDEFFTSAVDSTVVIMLRGTEGDLRLSHDTFEKGEMRIEREASGE